MDWRYNTVWFGYLPCSQYKSLDFKKNRFADSEIHEKYARFLDFKPKSKDFSTLKFSSNLLYLELLRSNIHSFSNIEQLGKVKRIETAHCLKLQSSRGLECLSDSLEWLHVNQSRKFIVDEYLLKLSNLRVLCLNNCAPIESLEFLKHLPNLVDFRFVDTNILDGNLNPLLEHPNLLNAGFMNKRHYNLKEKESDEHFESRNKGKVLELVDGEFRTFMYKAFCNSENKFG